MMPPPISTRWKFLGGLLVLSLIAAGWTAIHESETSEVVEAVKPVRTAPPRVRTSSEKQRAEPLLDIPLEKLRRQEAAKDVKEVFPSRSWYVPPPPAKPEPAPPPSAPPLPFIYLGKMVEDGKPTVFIANQDRNYTVKEGDVIDSTYRVDAIKGALMELTYIPLDMKQTMQIGERN